jgi:hypothetical protein
MQRLSTSLCVHTSRCRRRLATRFPRCDAMMSSRIRSSSSHWEECEDRCVSCVDAWYSAWSAREEMNTSRALYVLQATLTATVTANSVTFVNGIAPGDTYWFQVCARLTLVMSAAC